MPLIQSRAAVEIGQRYRQVTGGGGVWVVIGFTSDHAGNPHAQLTLEDDRTRIATIACAALHDRRLYQRLPGSTEKHDGTVNDGIASNVVTRGKSA